jgi:hypothetical protein
MGSFNATKVTVPNDGRISALGRNYALKKDPKFKHELGNGAFRFRQNTASALGQSTRREVLGQRNY